MLRRKNDLSSKKRAVIITASLLSFLVLAITTMVISVFAATSQTINSNFTISYVADHVVGVVRLRAYYKGDGEATASWHNLTNPSGDGKVTINSSMDSFSATISNLSGVGLSQENEFLVFECAFDNQGTNMVKLAFSESAPLGKPMVKSRSLSML